MSVLSEREEGLASNARRTLSGRKRRGGLDSSRGRPELVKSIERSESALHGRLPVKMK